MEKSKVYFTKTITKERLIDIFNKLGIKLEGNVGIKIHSGEEGNQNYLRSDFFEPIYNYLKGTFLECNTAYDGERNDSHKHLELLKRHEWTTKYRFDLMDENDNDIVLTSDKYNIISKDYVGEHFKKYDSILIVSHFKGHPMGGFGGSLKQLSIGFASSRGKAYIHSAGKTLSQVGLWDNVPPQEDFIAGMADAAFMVHNYFKGKIAYINVLKNMSVDCDCCSVAEDPCIKDIGILASLDPVALDKCSLDLIYNSNDEGLEHFKERVETRNGRHIFKACENLNFGNLEYEIIDID